MLYWNFRNHYKNRNQQHFPTYFCGAQNMRYYIPNKALQWSHNKHHGALNHQQLDCLFNRSFIVTSKKHQSPCYWPSVSGIHRWRVDSPDKGPVTSKAFSDVIFCVNSLSLFVHNLLRRLSSDWKQILLSHIASFAPMRNVMSGTTCTPFYWHGLTLITVWISNYMPGKVWGEITHPFLNFNGCTVAV